MSIRFIILIFALFLTSTFALAQSTEARQTPQKTSTPTKTKAMKKKVIPKDKKPSSLWRGSNASFGYVANTGNTNTETLNGALNINFTKNRWNNQFQSTAQLGSDNGVQNQEKYFVQNQLNYTFNKRRTNYLFINGNFTQDRFSPYIYQTVVSAGVGREILYNKRFSLNVQAGPGYMINKDNDVSTADDGFVFTTQTTASYRISRAGLLSQTLVYNFAEPYNYLKSISAFTNKIIGHLSAQISFTLTYYSKIPSGSTATKKTDTTTAIALVYTV